MSKKQSGLQCVICESKNTRVWTVCKDFEYHSSEEEYTYHKCDSCNTIFIDPMPVDKLQTIYPSNYYSFSEIDKSLAITIKEYLDKRIFRNILKKIKKDSINILDIGGGSGWLLDVIKSIDPRVNVTQVVDIDEQAKVIAEKNGHQYFHGSIDHFDTTEKFDFVLMLNLIEHIPNPLGTLTKIEQIMNKGGIVLIKTPNIESFEVSFWRNSYWGGLHCPRHWILFSQNSFRKMAGETQLSINSFKYTQGAPFWAWSTLIAMEKRGLVRIDAERPVINHPLIPFFNILFAAFDFLRGWLGFKTAQMVIELEKK